MKKSSSSSALFIKLVSSAWLVNFQLSSGSARLAKRQLGASLVNHNATVLGIFLSSSLHSGVTLGVTLLLGEFEAVLVLDGLECTIGSSSVLTFPRLFLLLFEAVELVMSVVGVVAVDRISLALPGWLSDIS